MILPYPENKIDSSKLKDFKRCPRFFFFRHVLGWQSQTPNNHLVFGSAWHEAMEHLLLNGYGDNSVIAAFDKFLACYRQSFPPETDEMFKGKTPDNAFWTLAQYANYPPYQQDFQDYEVLHTEIAGSVGIDKGRSVFFRQDAVLKKRKTGKIRSREHKTGSRTWQWEEQWLLDGQVGTYNHVLNCLYEPELVEGVEMNGSFFLNRKSKPKPDDIFRRFLVSKNLGQMQTWLDTVRYYVWEIEREYKLLEVASESDSTLFAFPMRDTSCLDYGRLCEYHDFCLSWQNPLRRCFEPPLGFKQEFWDPTTKPAKETFELGKASYKDDRKEHA